ncbi:MAG TPA: M1 family aminopeptidase [Polyangia bacterium]|nr:M1 family aminopeptidase [Polyangia bacterium]
MQRPFAPPGTKLQFTGDRPVRMVHARLEFDLDLAARAFDGLATLTLAARREQVTSFALDAVEMEIREVTLDGKPVPFDHDGETLRVRPPQALAADAAFRLAVRYHASPRRGLYFIGPDAHHPNRPLQCWSQGQDDDSRFYWPCIDAPIEKMTTEVICTAPAGNFVLSNGDLTEQRDLPGGKTLWHYVLDFPHPAYLVTLVCGPFAAITDRAPATGVDTYYFVPPGREADGRRSFARTPQMIDLYSKTIGVPYPHRRYSQIAVPDFIFGGMENTTATTLTDLTLLDERAALDHDVEALVSHELAHQWWGDLVTCREWSEAWLNEGFATYFEYIWREHVKGRDEADVELLNDAEGYLNEAGRYQRPVVCRQYEEPIHIFDAHLYEKGGRVVHMIRHELGDELFFRSLRTYVERHGRGSVETRDLARAIEQVSGRNLDELFDRWIGRPGHPDIEAAWQWDDDRKVGVLRVEQKQAISPEAPPFKFRTLLRFEVDGQERDEPLAVSEALHAFEIRLPSRPTQVIFDPGDVILKSIKMEKSRALWQRQLQVGRLGIDRVLAATGIARLVEPETVKALGAALRGDTFWAVRAAAARALGRLRRADALDLLLATVGDPHPRVRRAVVAGLGDYRGDERAAAALAGLLEKGDPSYFVEAEAASSLGRTRAAAALRLLPAVAARPSFQDVIRTRAIEGLGATGDEKAVALIKAQLKPGGPFQPRRAAVSALAELSAGMPWAREARELIESCLLDADFRVRGEAAAALARLGQGEAVPAIERALGGEMDGRAKRRMKEAIRDLKEGGKPPEQLRKAQEELDRLRGETAQLRERLEKLETRVGGSASEPKSPPKTKRPRPPARRRQRPHRPVRR